MRRLLTLGILVTSLFGYLEWADHSTFLFKAEYDILFHSDKSIESFVHPLILLPLAGQLILLVALIIHPKHFRLLFIGMALLSPLMLMIFLVGLLSLNVKILFSAVPFIILSIVAIL